MGTVFRQTRTRPLPGGAEVFTKAGQRFARWKPAKGKTRTAKVTTGEDGTLRIQTEAATFTAKFRNGLGVIREVSTHCRDEVAARSVLSKLERQAELVRSEIISSAEDATADHQLTPLAQHFAAFHEHRTAKGLSSVRIANTKSRLDRLADECGFGRLADCSAEALTRWLNRQQANGMSPGNRNESRQELIGFGNWCVETHRLSANPFSKVPKADAKLDRHALRGTFATLLSKGGVTPRTAQAAMRHSTIDLTMNAYTDPKLLDVCGALDSLPSLNLNASPSPNRTSM